MIFDILYALYYGFKGSIVSFGLIFFLEKIETFAKKRNTKIQPKRLINIILQKSKNFPLICSTLKNEQYGPVNTVFNFSQVVKRTDSFLIKLDLFLTKDNYIVISNCSNLNGIKDKVENIKYYYDIFNVDAGYSLGKHNKEEKLTVFPYRGKGIRIPTLDQFFSDTKKIKSQHGRVYYLLSVNSENLLDKTVTLITKYGLGNSVIIKIDNFFLNRKFLNKNEFNILVCSDKVNMFLIILLAKFYLLRFFILKHDVFITKRTFLGVKIISDSLIKRLNSINKILIIENGSKSDVTKFFKNQKPNVICTD